MELISIIVPVYNVEEYLPRCIDSLINQTYKNLEIILIDDGSTDNSGNICDQYANIYNNISVYHKKNGGLSSARNLGLDKINNKSKYIGFVDSDDFVNNRMYEILYNNLKKYDVGISACDIEKVYDHDYKLSEEDSHYEECVKDSIKFLEGYFENYCLSTVVCNKLYRREDIENIRFEVGKIYEDQLYSPEVIYKAKNVVITNAKLYYYYQRENSISHGGYNIDGWNDLLYAAENYIHFGIKIGNDIFIQKSSERYLGMIVNLTVNAYEKNKKEYLEWKKIYRRAFRKYVSKLANYKLKIMYSLFFIEPIIYKVINKN